MEAEGRMTELLTLPNDAALAELDGLITADEGRRLAHLASIAANDIVEIGSYRGRSTCYLALGSRAGRGAHVWAVDLWDAAPRKLDEEGRDFADPTNWREFCRQTQAMGVADYVTPLRQASTRAAAGRHDPIGLLFIDGNHTYAHSREDYLAWSPYVAAGGYLAMHDNIDLHPGVRRTVRQIIEPSGLWEDFRQTDSLWTARRRADAASPAVARRTQPWPARRRAYAASQLAPYSAWPWVDVLPEPEDASAPDGCGIVVMSFGEAASAEAAAFIATLRKSGNDYPVTAVGDTRVPGADFIAWDGTDPYDHARRSGLKFSAGLVKPMLYGLSPYTYTLYTDVDASVLRPLAPAFAMLARYDLLICGHRRQTVDQMYNEPGVAWQHDMAERAATVKEWGGDGSASFWNSGVIFFRRGDAAAAVFAGWAEEWQRWRRWDEQLALMRSAYHRPCVLGLLPIGWNSPHQPQATHIWHRYGRGGARSAPTVKETR